MSDGKLPVEQFPESAAAASRAVVEANRRLAMASMDAMLGGGRSRDLLFLRRARFDWSFHLTRQEDQVLFSFGSKEPEEVVLDATASFAFEPVPPEAPLPPSDGPVSYRWVLPPFLLWASSAEQVALWGPGGGATDENTIFLALGPSRERVLAAQFPPGGEVPRLAYLAGGRKLVIEARSGSWPLGAVLDLLSALATWVKADPELGTELPLTPASLAQPGDVLRILVALTKGWMAAEAGGRLGDQDEAGALPELFLSYGIDDLHSTVLLRLGLDGRLATPREDDPFQLSLRVRVARREAAVVTTAAISPPDFLVVGALHDAFGSLIRSEGVAGLLRQALADPALTTEVLGRLLNSPAAHWTVFRVARRPTFDTDVIVWESERAGRPALLILSADFVVDAGGPAPTVDLAGRPRLRARWLPADADLVDVLEDEAAYFVRLLRELYGWRRLIA